MKTLKDQIAIEAMKALIAKTPLVDSEKNGDTTTHFVKVVNGAYRYAEFMLLRRKGKPLAVSTSK